MRQIAENCGKDGAVIADEVRQMKGNMGFDASTGEWVDMMERGILDPAKVVRNALSNAASIAGLMLTTQVLVTRSDDADGGKKPAVEGAVR
jgi:chaperonin GroEL